MYHKDSVIQWDSLAKILTIWQRQKDEAGGPAHFSTVFCKMITTVLSLSFTNGCEQTTAIFDFPYGVVKATTKHLTLGFSKNNYHRLN